MSITSEKFLKLADFLENAVDDAQFSMRHWATTDANDQLETACAAGWATVCFPDSGLRLIPVSESLRHRMGIALGDSTSKGSMEALCNFFDINRDELVKLFLRDAYPDSAIRCEPTKAEVIARLREFAAAKK